MFSVHCDCCDYYFYLMDITFLPLCRIILNVRFTISNINRLSTLIINTKYRVNLLEKMYLQKNTKVQKDSKTKLSVISSFNDIQLQY
jgi:hypothetical protein